jgi:two-component system LytT family response regulator
MIRALIVDDERIARERVRLMLARHDDVEVIGERGDGDSAREAITTLHPDLLFLDVEMPELSGTSLVRHLPLAGRPVVLFVTAHREHALDAFDLTAADYLLKPFTQDRFDRALDRARKAVLARRRERAAERLPFKKSRGKVVFVRASTIRRITAEGNYSRLHTTESSLLVRESIQSLAARLDPSTFVRAHRSAIVNVQYVVELHRDSDGSTSVLLDRADSVPIGPKFQPQVERALGVDSSQQVDS